MRAPQGLTMVVLSAVMGGVVDVVGTLTPERPAMITGRMITGRAEGAATVSLAPPKDYIGTATPPAAQTGVELAFADDGADGMNVFLSSELAKKIEEAVGQNCDDALDGDCQKAVQEVLQAKEVKLRTRQVAAAFFGLVRAYRIYIAGLAGYLLASKQPIPINIHLGKQDQEQVSAIGDKNEVHVVTSANAPPAVTITDAPVPTTADGEVVSISVVTAASGDLAEGDQVIHLPPAEPQRMQDFLGMENPCAGTKKGKRAIDGACLQASAENLVLNSMPGSAFDGLFFFQGVAFRIGNMAQQDYVQALVAVQQFAEGLAPGLNVDAKKASALGALAFALVYKVYIDGEKLAEENVFAASEIATGPITAADPTKTNDGCPTDAPKTDGPSPLGCPDDNCKGDKDKKACQTGEWNGCPCLNVVTYRNVDQYDTALGNAQASMFQEIFDGKADDGPTSTKWCQHAASPRQYKGTGWCACGDGKSYEATSVDITTTNEAGDPTVLVDVCPYTTAPGKTYEPTPVDTGGAPAETAPTEDPKPPKVVCKDTGPDDPEGCPKKCNNNWICVTVDTGKECVCQKLF
ncbi:MAG: hypothetical protein M1817_002258 [Caeruleum heppii]|nr:MAG: hypothetical protein M1817_002258 [Caeruleum heppii]